MNRKGHIAIAKTVRCAAMAALICVSSLISIPLTVPPITMQIFGVFFSLFTLGGKGGFVSVLLYTAIGTLGLPVFSGFSGGVGVLFGISGGYIFGFIAASLLYWLLERFVRKNRAFMIFTSIILMLVIYMFACVQFVIISKIGGNSVGFISALVACVLPYTIPDAVKIFSAALVSRRINRYIGIV